jgi:hypothetical protein
MKRLWTGHKISPITNYVNLWPLRVTLTLEVGAHALSMTYPIIIVTICSKYFQNPLIYEEIMDVKQNIPYNRLC